MSHKMTPASVISEEQRLKIECDAHGFQEAAAFAANSIDSNQLQPMSSARNAMSTVLLTNLGLSLELKLKAIAIRIGRPVIHTHNLALLFENLTDETKNSLEGIYEEGEYEFTAFLTAPVSIRRELLIQWGEIRCTTS